MYRKNIKAYTTQNLQAEMAVADPYRVIQLMMQGCVERRFGDSLPASPVEWLTDNGSAYRAHETRALHEKSGWSPERQQ